MFGLWLTMLLHLHGRRILRVKGLLNVGTSRGPMMLEGVQHVIHAPRHLSEWPDDHRQSRLVFIVRDLDLVQIEKSLNVFQDLAATLHTPFSEAISR
jgi:G3E family GTPase